MNRPNAVLRELKHKMDATFRYLAFGVVCVMALSGGCLFRDTPMAPRLWPANGVPDGETVCVEGDIVTIIQTAAPRAGILVVLRVPDELQRVVRVTVIWPKNAGAPHSGERRRVSGVYKNNMIEATAVIPVKRLTRLEAQPVGAR